MSAGNQAELLAYLETTLAQLDAVAGEADPETHASLDKLRQALNAADAPVKAQACSVPVDEASLELLLESLDKQMGALEAVLEALPPDANEILAAGMSKWQGEEPQAPSADAELDQAQPPIAPHASYPPAPSEPGVLAAVIEAQEEDTRGVDQSSSRVHPPALAQSTATNGDA